MLRYLLIFALTFYAGNSKASSDDSWKKLLHYRSSLFGTLKSEVDNIDFFLSNNGQTNPEEEYKANKKALMELNMRCRFPARALYFNLSIKHCDKYQKFREQLNFDSLKIVFASYFVKDPASSFGHLFLRLDRGDSNDLLDYGVSFAADTGKVSTIYYVFGGLTGAFKATHQELPFYLKVKEYSDMEDRDLWEYEVPLTNTEKERFLAHLFELREAHFDYYFLNENCAYHVLTLLEAAAPRLNFRSQAWVLPVDSLHQLAANNINLTTPTYRPSPMSQFNFGYQSLHKKKKRLFQKNLKEQNIPDSAEDIELLIDAIDTSPQAHANEKIQTWRHKLLSKRSQLPPSVKVQAPAPLAPHRIHPSQRFGLGLQNQNSVRASFNYRPTFHSHLDPSGGPLKTVDMELLHSRLTADQGQLRLEDLNLIYLRTRQNWDGLLRRPSWQFALSYNHESKSYARLGGGVSKLPWSLFLNGEIRADGLYVGPEIFFHRRWFQQIHTALKLQWMWVPGAPFSFERLIQGDIQWNINRIWSAGLSLSQVSGQKDLFLAQLHHYF